MATPRTATTGGSGIGSPLKRLPAIPPSLTHKVARARCPSFTDRIKKRVQAGPQRFVQELLRLADGPARSFVPQSALFKLSKQDRVQLIWPVFPCSSGVPFPSVSTTEKVNAAGNFRIRLDSGRAVSFNIRENPHLDHGYAVTSHSSQGQTADRVLIHVDAAPAGEKLVNRGLAYVAISRGRYDAQIYTNDKTQLAEGLGRDVSSRSAIEPSAEVTSSAPKHPPERERERARERERERTQSYSIDG